MGISFEALGLEHSLLRSVREMGFDETFPIQAEAIAPLLQGRDVLGQAHTGAGKTLAYALPMLQRLNPNALGIRGLVVVPTRELAVQVAGEFEKLGRRVHVRTVAIYGGQSIRVQMQKLDDPASKIIVATPGRLIDHLKRRTVKLNNVHFVVLDEADRMLDMGFIDDVEIILREVPRTHQTALFSATMPREIVKLSQRYMKNPLKLFVDTDEPNVDSVEQKFARVEEQGKYLLLRVILKQEHVRKGLIFCETKIRADRLANALQQDRQNALALHGDLSQHQRDDAIGSFRAGETNLLVATDVAARGLDISKVTHVINYDLPEEPLMYFHRIGRTARAGKAGIALSFVSRQDENMFSKVRHMTSANVIDLSGTLQPQAETGAVRFHLPPRPFQGLAARRDFSRRRPGRHFSRRRFRHRER